MAHILRRERAKPTSTANSYHCRRGGVVRARHCHSVLSGRLWSCGSRHAAVGSGCSLPHGQFCGGCRVQHRQVVSAKRRMADAGEVVARAGLDRRLARCTRCPKNFSPQVTEAVIPIRVLGDGRSELRRARLVLVEPALIGDRAAAQDVITTTRHTDTGAVYRGTRMIAHEGGDTGYRTNLVLLPDKRIAVVWMQNAEWAAADDSLRARHWTSHWAVHRPRFVRGGPLNPCCPRTNERVSARR